MDLIRPWLDEALKTRANEVFNDPARFNYKDALQEWTQRKYKILPEYRVSENKNFDTTKEAQKDTANIARRFIAEVWLQDRCLGSGLGRSKKASQQAAAKVAFLAVRDT